MNLCLILQMLICFVPISLKQKRERGCLKMKTWMSKSIERRSMFMLHVWDQVTLVWNTRETGDIYFSLNWNQDRIWYFIIWGLKCIISPCRNVNLKTQKQSFCQSINMFKLTWSSSRELGANISRTIISAVRVFCTVTTYWK